jgi:L-histidine N-alpha-methyltransferase
MESRLEKKQQQQYQHFASPRGFYMSILTGLEAFPKYLPSVYLYDDSGSGRFANDLLDEFYLLDREFQVLNEHLPELMDLLTGSGQAISLFEFCPGAPEKRTFLLQQLLNRKAELSYFPVDISQDSIDQLLDHLYKNFAAVKTLGSIKGFLEAVAVQAANTGGQKILQLLGESLSSVSREQAYDFFASLRTALATGDRILMGSELRKDPASALLVQQEKSSNIRELSTNLLQRINRELHADFQTGQFSLYQNYDPVSGLGKSFLVSQSDQVVTINGAHMLRFEQHEAIGINSTQSYTQSEIRNLATRTGFLVEREFTDTNCWFTNTVWKAV